MHISAATKEQTESDRNQSGIHQHISKANKMGDNNISEKLKMLSMSTNRSATARLREIFEDIEKAIKLGVRRKDIHQVLKENGFDISFSSFELAIYRIRQEKSKQKVNVSAKPVALEKSVAVTGAASGNPLRVLSGKPKEGEFNPIPTARIEIDKS